MKKILLPVDGSPRSMKAADLVRKLFKPEECEVYIVTVIDDEDAVIETNFSMAKVKLEAEPILEKAAGLLDGYVVVKEALAGKGTAQEIIHYASSINAHAIVMTKSTKTAFKRVLGSVTENVVKSAPCIVIIVPEKDF